MKKIKHFLGEAKRKTVSFFHQCVRVWHLTRKPDKEEIKIVSKVSAIGILAIGVIGFILATIVEFILKLGK